MKELETHWPCGCYTYREGMKFFIRPCSIECIVYHTVIEISKKLGSEIRYQEVNS